MVMTTYLIEFIVAVAGPSANMRLPSTALATSPPRAPSSVRRIQTPLFLRVIKIAD